jgi:hypothetical protein
VEQVLGKSSLSRPTSGTIAYVSITFGSQHPTYIWPVTAPITLRTPWTAATACDMADSPSPRSWISDSKNLSWRTSVHVRLPNQMSLLTLRLGCSSSAFAAPYGPCGKRTRRGEEPGLNRSESLRWRAWSTRLSSLAILCMPIIYHTRSTRPCASYGKKLYLRSAGQRSFTWMLELMSSYYNIYLRVQIIHRKALSESYRND